MSGAGFAGALTDGGDEYRAADAAGYTRRPAPAGVPVEVHALVWEFDRDTTTCKAVCNAAEDATCRLYCAADCETWCEINRLTDETLGGETVHRITHDDCDAGMRPGECNVCLFLNESGCVEELALGGYPHGPRFVIAAVPIRPSWTGDGYEWEPEAAVIEWRAAQMSGDRRQPYLTTAALYEINSRRLRALLDSAPTDGGES